MVPRFTAGGGGDGGDEDHEGSTPGDPTPDMNEDENRAAEYVRQLKNRVRRLEENRAMRGDFVTSDGAVLSPITRVVDRRTVADDVTVTLDSGASSSFIDNFEDDDMAEYSDPDGAADTVSYPVYEQDYAVRVRSDSNGVPQTPVVSTSGLPYYPAAGDTFRYRCYCPSDAIASLYFGADSDGSNGYRVDVDEAGDQLVAYEVNDGSLTTLFSEDAGSVASGGWLEVAVVWQDGGGFDAKLFAEDGTTLASGSTTNATYTAGGVGYACTNGSGVLGQSRSCYFDYVRTTNSAKVIDDFEDDDVSEYSGDTGSASVEAASQIPVEHGNNALELSGQATIYAAKGNLNDDAVPGDTFDSHHYPTTGSTAHFMFGVQDGSNYYFAEVDEPNGELNIGVVDGGSTAYVSQNTGVSVPVDEWIELHVDWATDGGIVVDLFSESGTKVASVSGQDSTHGAGGHGWAERGTVSSFHDYALTVVAGSKQRRTVGIIDDFEDGDIAEYYGSTGDWSVQTGTVYEGTYALESSVADVTGITSQSGLPRYPQAGDTFRARIRFENDTSVNREAGFAFFMKDDGTNNARRYRVEVRADNPDMQLNIIGNDVTNSTLAATSIPQPNADEWYEFRVDTGEGGRITFELYDESGAFVDSVEAIDARRVDGGIHPYRLNDTTEPVYMDSFEITDTTASTGVIDGFEDNDIDEYGGDKSIYTVQTGTVYDGTYALKGEQSGETTIRTISSLAGLSKYPQPGDTFRYRVYPANLSDNVQYFVQFATQSETSVPDRYSIKLDGGGDEFEISKRVNGSFTELAAAPQTYSSQWYKIQVEWADDGTITATLYDDTDTQLTQITATDTTFVGGGVGWVARAADSNASAKAFFDLAEIV